MGRDGATVFSMIFGWSRVVIGLKVFCLARLPFSWSFGWIEQAFVNIVFLCAHWCFQFAGFFNSKRGWGTWAKNVNSENSLFCYLGFEFPSLFPSLHLSETLILCLSVTFNVQVSCWT